MRADNQTLRRLRRDFSNGNLAPETRYEVGVLTATDWVEAHHREALHALARNNLGFSDNVVFPPRPLGRMPAPVGVAGWSDYLPSASVIPGMGPAVALWDYFNAPGGAVAPSVTIDPRTGKQIIVQPVVRPTAADNITLGIGRAAEQVGSGVKWAIIIAAGVGIGYLIFQHQKATRFAP
jgi:hypothetical protein